MKDYLCIICNETDSKMFYANKSKKKCKKCVCDESREKNKLIKEMNKITESNLMENMIEDIITRLLLPINENISKLNARLNHMENKVAELGENLNNSNNYIDDYVNCNNDNINDLIDRLNNLTVIRPKLK